MTLYGQLFSAPNINVQAFQSTMRRAWRIDSVNITQVDQKTFAFTFKSENEMKRVRDSGPQSFSSILIDRQERSSRTRDLDLIRTALSWTSRGVRRLSPRMSMQTTPGRARSESERATTREGRTTPRMGSLQPTKPHHEVSPIFCRPRQSCGLFHYPTEHKWSIRPIIVSSCRS